MDNEFTSYRESHKAKGLDYQNFCESNPHAQLMWRLERHVLRKLIGKLPAESRGSYLDFACGTGRIHAEIAPLFRQATGVDVSSTMLAVAQKRAPYVTHLLGDITVDDSLVAGPYDVITAFRFFLNAEPALRDSAMAALRARMHSSSVLFFNVHRNSGSITHRLLLARGRKEHELRYMSASEVQALLSRHSLTIKSRHGFGLFPSTEQRMPLPVQMAYPLERAAHIVLNPWRLGSDVLYEVVPA